MKYFSLSYLVLLALGTIFIFSSLNLLNAQTNPNQPNILVIISDDLGVDYANGYQDGGLRPTTPVLDRLRAEGITFTNAWAAPSCAPTRATIVSGKYGNKTGVLQVPGNLGLEHTSLFLELDARTGGAYANGVFGKWHLASPIDNDQPAQHGVQFFDGIIRGGVQDYYNWTKVTNGEASDETTYITSYLTNSATEWVNNQDQPWFLWMAYNAPHTPFHDPPSDLFTIENPETNQERYVAAIEALDSEIGRLLNNIPADELENTLIIYIGDNGTPNQVLQNFPAGQAKGSVYQGGIHVPMTVTGAGVSRQNEIEDALIHSADLYATILEATGSDLPGGVYNSFSFNELLTNANATSRPYNYSESIRMGGMQYAIRDAQYKLIELPDGTQEFYDLLNDPLETSNLIDNLSDEQFELFNRFEEEAQIIQTGWSCNDLILNGDEVTIDDCGDMAADPIIEEAPVEEAPVEEAPVEETPVEEAPVEEAPVEEAPTNDGSTDQFFCGGVSITYGNGAITIQGQEGERYFVKVEFISSQWASVLNCSSDCGTSQSVDNLSDGTYMIRIFNDRWAQVCSERISMSSSSTDDDESTSSGSVDCGSVNVSYSNGDITMTGPSGSSYFFKVARVSPTWEPFINCIDKSCGNSQSLSNVPNGTYSIRIFETTWQRACDEIQIEITGSRNISKSRSSQASKEEQNAFYNIPSPVSLFPNPATHQITVDLSSYLETAVDIQLISIEGKVLQHFKLPKNHSNATYQMDISEMTNGLYQVQVSSKETNQSVRLPVVVAK